MCHGAAVVFVIMKEIFIIIFSVIFSSIDCSSDIKGCGGFLKSPVQLDFSSVFVKLYTRQGVLKESSDCAPTNGYYFIPVYDKGEYVLKIEPPAGWFFTPKEIAINFDGSTDLCSQSTDINFTFQGFAVSGQLSARGSDRGPDGVSVILTPDGDAGEAITTSTGKSGSYLLAPVMPGKYIISGKHAVYKFSKNQQSVTVDINNIEIPKTVLVVAGYDLIGQVVSNGVPIKGVSILIYSFHADHAGIPLNCDTTTPAGAPTGALCHVTSDKSGKFRFTAVPSGQYILRPYYASFEVLPQTMEVTVLNDPVTLTDKFTVRGFSVKGKTISGKLDKGISGVKIFVDKVQVTSTDANGQFSLKDMEPGKYTISGRNDDYDFGDNIVKISPSTPELDPMMPQSVRVCGRVVPVAGQTAGQVEIRSTGKTNVSPILATPHRETGQYCQMVPPGTYKVSVFLTDKQQSQRLQYLPAFRELTVADIPVTGLDFSQLRAVVRGRLVRLHRAISDRGLTVKLRLRDSIIQTQAINPNEETFAFENVLPGTYDVDLESSLLCFEPSRHEIVVNAPEILVPSFVQTGYIARIISSHDTEVKVRTTKKEMVKTINVVEGRSENCLPSAGVFEFEPVGCHGYQSNTFLYEIGQDEPLKLEAVSHDIGITVFTSNKSPVTVEVSTKNAIIHRLTSTEPALVPEGFYRFYFKYRALDGVPLQFSPKAQLTVFTPETVEFQAKGDCFHNAMQFAGEEGFNVEGRVTPPLAGVKITMTSSSQRHDQVVETGTNGKFAFGPVKLDAKFDLKASKESYVLTGPTIAPDKTYTFLAHKLAQVHVKVVDNTTNARLSGVLLSLTGGEKYRKNSITEDSGERIFYSLSPGEYFLRPMMKEYKFEPSSLIIKLKAGETYSVQVVGRRVSFSAFGIVTSLNGDPEPNVPLEAVGLDTCSNLQEEGASESNGLFRIRGLLPQCEYSVRMKADPPSNVYRIAPSDLVLKTRHGDVTGVRLIAFHRLEHVDMSVHVTATVPEHLKTLTLKLSKEDMPESPIHIVRLDSLAGGVKHWGSTASQERFLRPGLLVQLPFIPRDGTTYVISIESTLNRASHLYSEPNIKITADKPYLSLKLQFHAKLRPAEQESPRHLVVGLFLGLATLIYIQIKQGWPLATLVMGWWTTKTEGVAASRQDRQDASIVGLEARKKIKSRKA